MKKFNILLFVMAFFFLVGGIALINVEDYKPIENPALEEPIAINVLLDDATLNEFAYFKKRRTSKMKCSDFTWDSSCSGEGGTCYEQVLYVSGCNIACFSGPWVNCDQSTDPGEGEN